jgi:hypothetical protein
MSYDDFPRSNTESNMRKMKKYHISRSGAISYPVGNVKSTLDSNVRERE